MKLVAYLIVLSVCLFRVGATPYYYYNLSYASYAIVAVSMFVFPVSILRYIKIKKKFFALDLLAIAFGFYILFHWAFLTPFLKPNEFMYRYATSALKLIVHPEIIGAFVFFVYNILYPRFIVGVLLFKEFKRAILFFGWLNLFIAVTQWLYFYSGSRFLIGVNDANTIWNDGLIWGRASGLFTNPFPFALFMIFVAIAGSVELNNNSIYIRMGWQSTIFLFGSLLSNSKIALVCAFVVTIYFLLLEKRSLTKIFVFFTFLAIGFWAIDLYFGLDVLRFISFDQFDDVSRKNRFEEALPFLLKSPIYGYGFHIQFYTDTVLTYLPLLGGVPLLLLWFLFLVFPALMLWREDRVAGRLALVMCFILLVYAGVTSSVYAIPNIFIYICLIFYFMRRSQSCFN